MSGYQDAGSSAERPSAVEPEAGPSRRSILWGAAGAGAAGLAAAAMARAAPVLAAAGPAASGTRASAAPASQAGAGEPVVVHVRDVQAGEMDLYAGTSHTRLRDRDLAARLARAVR